MENGDTSPRTEELKILRIILISPDCCTVYHRIGCILDISDRELTRQKSYVPEIQGKCDATLIGHCFNLGKAKFKKKKKTHNK